MELKQRGRKAEAGTIEAREYVTKGHLESLFAGFAGREGELSNEAVARIMKAAKFGLGIKETVI